MQNHDTDSDIPDLVRQFNIVDPWWVAENRVHDQQKDTLVEELFVHLGIVLVDAHTQNNNLRHNLAWHDEYLPNKHLADETDSYSQQKSPEQEESWL